MTDASYQDQGSLSDQPPRPSAPSSTSGPSTLPPAFAGPGGFGVPGAAGILSALGGRRTSDQWGKDDPALASSRSYPGVDPNPYMRSNLGRAFMGVGRGQWSNSVRPDATKSVYYLAAYYKAKRAAQAQNDAHAAHVAAMAWQQFQLSSARYLDKQGKELQRYHDVVNEAKKDPGSDWRTELLTEAAKNGGDDLLENLIKSGADLSKVESYLQSRDSTWLGANKAALQANKAGEGDLDPRGGDDDAEDQQPQQPSQQQQQQPPQQQGQPSQQQPSQQQGPQQQQGQPAGGKGGQPPAPAATPPVQTANAAPNDTTNAVPARPATAPDAAPEHHAPSALGGGTNFTTNGPANTDISGLPHVDGPATRETAHQVLNGKELSGIQMSKHSHVQVQAYEAAMERKLHDIADSSLTGQQVVDAVRKVDGSFGDIVAGVASNQQGLPQTGWGGRLYEMSQLVTRLARKANPDWKPWQYKALEGFRDRFMNENGPAQQAFANSVAVVPSLHQLLRATNALPQNANIPQIYIDQIIAGTFRGVNPGDEKYKDFLTAARIFAQDASRVAFGAGRVGPYSDILKGMWGTPLQVRAAIRDEASALDGRAQSYRNEWQSIQGDGSEPPGYAGRAATAHEAYEAVANMDPYTNTTSRSVPSDISGDLHQVDPQNTVPGTFKRYPDGIVRYQDKKTGKWYKVQ